MPRKELKLIAYVPAENRYEKMVYRRCGRSGLDLPAISLGLWHNFGHDTPHETKRAIVQAAFDNGITHFDLANNYGPKPGAAEQAFGELLRTDFAPYRDEMIISSKAGYGMWPGPYGNFGSRKYLLASLDRLEGSGIETLDIDNEYYETIFDRVPNVTEDRAHIQRHKVLVDGDDEGYLLQIFTKNVIGPIFIELIQRKNHLSFGEGNFGALFRSIERDQERRGVL